ncbi:uncharacterized protein LOC132700132 [Cylas formicarius]|uniref:uncharacterized protein LOC132700132 n=1 Tax=Cylas formicarius TaxID=197179 RepID=UPI002958B83E|nr:uncharacterized protein LOC132700132 [Cylas formicarius]
MMKSEQHKKVIIKVESEIHQENVKNTRRTLKTLQPAAQDKENLAGRPLAVKEARLTLENDSKKKNTSLMHKSTQTEKYVTNAEDLTSENASPEYWRRLAEKRQEALDESFLEIEKLKGDIETLQEENKICKEMLQESRNLVEVLQEMIEEGDAEEAKAGGSNTS